MTGVRSRPFARRMLDRAALALALLWTLFPVVWAFALSIKRPADFFTARVLPFVQFHPTLDNWRGEWRALGEPAGLGHGLANSLIVATAITGVSLAIGLLAAFGLALGRRRRHPIWPFVALFLLPRIFPPVVTVIPFAVLMQWLGLSDTVLALIVADTTFALPLAILILYVSIEELPRDLVDAAQIDGCGMLATLRLIVAPLLLPALLSTAALCFAQSWNEFLYALMNVQQHAQTAPLAIAALLTKDGIEFEYVGSHLLMVMLPPLLLALAARRVIVRGLSLGTVKDAASS
jgi:ABC-type glycerol-3-phosphate transport system permease component